MTVLVSRKKVSDVRHLPKAAKCASVSKANNALFHPRVHFECPETKRGRSEIITNRSSFLKTDCFITEYVGKYSSV
jgi:hypothetical protein